jgi:NADPH:quinone reductase-like Zn-dependent oxidoreductase
MRAAVIAKHGGLDVLEVQERSEPSPGPGEVRIGVRAAGVNFADTPQEDDRRREPPAGRLPSLPWPRGATRRRADQSSRNQNP